jgi:release factor glutamine methyltransferase
MTTEELYAELLGGLSAELVLSPDLPDETAETTLKALWHAAAGKPCSAARALGIDLPELRDEQVVALRDAVDRRLAGVPLMQITGRVEFMGLELLFEPNVCLVRPETEILGRYAVNVLSNCLSRQRDPLMIDIGCGSGNLSCGIAKKIPKLRVYSVDTLKSCVELTKRNVGYCGLEDRICVSHGDLFAPLKELDLRGAVDVVVCNPPYISSARLKTDRSHLLEHEPHEALDGGAYGFSVHQRLIKEAPEFLMPGGWLLFEFGAGQHRQVQSLFERSKAFDLVEFATDAHGAERVGAGRRTISPGIH